MSGPCRADYHRPGPQHGERRIGLRENHDNEQLTRKRAELGPVDQAVSVDLDDFSDCHPAHSRSTIADVPFASNASLTRRRVRSKCGALRWWPREERNKTLLIEPRGNYEGSVRTKDGFNLCHYQADPPLPRVTEFNGECLVPNDWLPQHEIVRLEPVAFRRGR
jgi:hypothetical protein